MDSYDWYISVLTEPTPGLPNAVPQGSVAQDDEGDGYTIDKTYAQLKAMYDKGNLSCLKWHLGDGTVIRVPLAQVTEDAFAFSTLYDAGSGLMTYTFTLNSSDELTFTEGATTGGNAMKVVPLKDGEPDVSDPDPSIIYLTPGATASDPYTRWVYSDGSWEDIGTADVDLEEYVSKAELNHVFDGLSGAVAYKE